MAFTSDLPDCEDVRLLHAAREIIEAARLAIARMQPASIDAEDLFATLEAQLTEMRDNIIGTAHACAEAEGFPNTVGTERPPYSA